MIETKVEGLRSGTIIRNLKKITDENIFCFKEKFI